MRPSRRPTETDEPQGAPEWMVTFSDCMTLLLTFFVLLLSFSSFDEEAFQKFKVIFSQKLPSISPGEKMDKDAFLPASSIQRPLIELDEGSEKPTLALGDKDALKKETEPVDFRSRKVFLIPSKKIFWAKGTAISSAGRHAMAIMAPFLKEVPNRIVVSENGPDGNKDSKNFGLPRAWAVIDYLITKQGLDRKRFSISATSTVADESIEEDETGLEGPHAERMVEITLLERSIYN